MRITHSALVEVPACSPLRAPALSDHREDTALVLAWIVRVKRLCVADERSVPRVVTLEGMKPAVEIHIIGDRDPIGGEGVPGMRQLEEEVSGRVRAVMHEQIDRPDPR
jgi:hypothetical protein